MRVGFGVSNDCRRTILYNVNPDFYPVYTGSPEVELPFMHHCSKTGKKLITKSFEPIYKRNLDLFSQRESRLIRFVNS